MRILSNLLGKIEYASDYSGSFVNRSLVDKGYVTGITTTLTTTANNGITKTGTNFRLGGSLTGNTTITTATGSRLNIAGWPMQYSTDLSANFTPRSLVDKGYVTGITSTLGNVTKVGTPVDNQIGVWTGNGTIEGTTNLTYNNVTLALTPVNSVLSLGTTTSTGTATPTTLDMGGTYADTIVSSKAKWKLYNNGTASATYGIGITANQFNFFISSGSAYKWYANDLLKMTLSGDTGNLLVTGTVVGSNLTGTNTGDQTANNGVQTVGKNIRLGGSLTGNTTINVVGNQLTITGTTSDPLQIMSSTASGRAGLYVRNTNSAAQATNYMDNNRGSFAAYGGQLVGGSTNTTNNLFGLTRQDKFFVFSDGASSLGMAIGTLTAQPFYLGTNNTERGRFISTGQFGLGVTAPTAILHLKAGTSSVNTAPLKLTTGTALATPEDGAIEYHSSHLYFTIGSTRYQIDQQSAGSITANNGLNIVGTNVRLGGNLTGSTTIGLGSNILTFTGTTGTIKYGSNLSANFTSRSLVDKGYVTGNSETLNAKNYGATGDGTTDDASALNTWLNAGNNLYLPEGVYKIGSTISTTSARTGVTITAHPSARIVPTAGFSQTTSFFYFQNVTDLHINGVYIEGNGAIASPALTGSSKTMEGFFCEDCNKILIENCILTKQPKAGVQVYDSTDVKIINNYIPGAYNFAIWVWNGSNILISGNKVSGQGTAQHDGTPLGAVPGVMVTTADYVTIENNIIEDFKNTATKTEGCDHVIYSNNYVREFGKDGIKVQAYTPTVTGVTDAKIINNTVQYSRPWDTDGAGLIVVNDTKEFIISGNIIKGGLRGDTLGDEHGIFLYSFGAYRTSKGLISNNTIDTVCRQGILGEFCDDIIVENNYIRNYSTDLIDVSGIQFLGTPTKIKILNNKVLQDSTPGGSDFGSGINVGNDALDIEINGNEITNPRELGILVNAGASDYIKISENSIKMSNGYPPVGLTGSGVAKLIKVNDNVFSGNVGTGGIWVNRSSTITDLSVIGNAMNTTSSAPFMQVSSLISKLTESGNNISGSATLPIYSTVPTLIQQGIYHFRGSGSPEGVVTATIGAIYTRTDENTAGTIYTKDSGTGNTGWNPINSVDLDFALMASFRNLYQY